MKKQTQAQRENVMRRELERVEREIATAKLATLPRRLTRCMS